MPTFWPWKARKEREKANNKLARKLEPLLAMGFSSSAAEYALSSTKTVDEAIEMLLAATPPSPRPIAQSIGALMTGVPCEIATASAPLAARVTTKVDRRLATQGDDTMERRYAGLDEEGKRTGHRL